MKNSIEVVSMIKFITVNVPIEVQSFKCAAKIQIVIDDKGEILDKEFMDFTKVEFMGLPVKGFCTFRKKMEVEFGVDIMKLVEDQIDTILTDEVCKTILADSKF
jgi:hypothetical protein